MPQQDVQQINDQEVATIYYQRYWLSAKCDALRRKLDLAAFDTAVNMGPNRAIKVLQQAVGCDADGAFGDKTKAACDSCDLGEAMINYCDIREGIYRTLAQRPAQDKFLKGWLNRLNALRSSWACLALRVRSSRNPIREHPLRTSRISRKARRSRRGARHNPASDVGARGVIAFTCCWSSKPC